MLTDGRAGLFPIAYLARARRTRARNPSAAAADLAVASNTASRYIVGYANRVPAGLPAV